MENILIELVVSNTAKVEFLEQEGKRGLNQKPSVGGRCGLIFWNNTVIGRCRNVRGLGKSMVVFHLFEKLRYSNERTTKFESLNQE